MPWSRRDHMFIATKDKGVRLRRSRMFICQQTCRSYGASSFLIGRESYRHLAALRPGQEFTNTLSPHYAISLTITARFVSYSPLQIIQRTSTSSMDNKFKPALIGGLVTGILSVIPFVSAANLCCCLWAIVGG